MKPRQQAPARKTFAWVSGDPDVAAGDGSRPLACAKSRTLDVLKARGAT